MEKAFCFFDLLLIVIVLFTDFLTNLLFALILVCIPTNRYPYLLLR